MQTRDPALRELHKHRVLKLAELKRHGASAVKMRRMAEAGLVLSLGAGIYATPALDPFAAAVLATAKYYPNAVISGLTALQIHGLAQEYVDRVDVDVPRETSIRNSLLNVHRVPKGRLVGITRLKHQGVEIQIYDRERSLCEAFRIDPSGPLFFRALKRYLRSGTPDPQRILKYDRAARTDVLSHLKQELADG
jgi:predicted transcriptional regulator of viral defense system